MIYTIIALSDRHPDAPLYWCGYKDKCHRWLPGADGKARAIRFKSPVDAGCSGVSGPNTPYEKTEDWPDRGIKMIAVEED